MDYKKFLGEATEAPTLYITRKQVYDSYEVPDSVEIASGMPSPVTVPYVSATFKCKDGSELHIDEETMKKITPYQKTRGMPDMIKWMTIIHKEFHNPPKMGAAEDGSQWGVTLCPGALGGMDYLFQGIMRKNDVVFLDEFAFGGTKKQVRKNRAVYVGMPMDGDGVIPDKLRDYLDRWEEVSLPFANGKKLNKPRVICMTPVGQNPTGVNTPLKRKQEIYKIAQEYNLLIVEDDPYYYLQYSETPIPSYQALDVDGRVVRIDSMSKFITPGMRMGWISGPEEIISNTSKHMSLSCMSLSCFTEIAVVKLFDNLGIQGLRDRVKYLRDFYRERRDTVEELVRKHLAGMATWTTPTAGMYLWLNISGTNDSMFLADKELCKKYKVYVVPALDFACDITKKYSQIRICFARAPQSDLEKGIPWLAKFISDRVGMKI